MNPLIKSKYMYTRVEVEKLHKTHSEYKFYARTYKYFKS